jgi:methionine sulfoxide reductase heme-binding subunit
MNNQLLWYATRGAGAVTLILLSGVVILGLAARTRFERRGWPRFLSATLHRDLALMALVFLGLHIVTAVVDPFTHLGIVAATVPFGSYYRTIWLGLGTVSFELILAIIVTSLFRRVIGHRFWRSIHWLAYAAWPVAVLHGIGTGTDAFSWWMLGITAVCVVAVIAAVVWRLSAAPGDPLEEQRRVAARQAAFGVTR